MSSKRLSYKLKKELYPIIIERDHFQCLYCPEPFTEENNAEWEHPNNEPTDNRPENLVLAHHTCNINKKYTPELQVIAREKLEQNEKSTFVYERKLADTGTTEQLSSQQQISKLNKQITKQWLEEHTLLEGEVLLKDSVNAIVNLCDEMNGTGSQSAVYRYIDSLTNPYNGRFTLSVNSDGKTVIRRRVEN